MHPSVKNGSVSVSGDLTVSGNLTISGNTTTLNTETLAVEDNKVVLNSSVTATPSADAGIEIERGTSDNVELRWNETTDKWQFSNDGTTYVNIASTIDLSNHESDTTNIHGIANTAELVTLSGAQNLTNKTLDASSITGVLTGRILVGNSSNVAAAVAVSGDITLDSNGIAQIASGAIYDGDINANALIQVSKLYPGTAGQVLLANAGGIPTFTTLSGDVTLASNGAVTIAANSVALGTDTTGNYMVNVAGGTGVTVTHTPGEGSTATIAIGQAVATNSEVTFAGIKVTSVIEPVTVSATAATGTIALDAASGTTYYTSNASANFVVNLRWNSGTSLNDKLAVNEMTTTSFMVTNGASAFYPTTVQVNGTVTGVTTRWQGGTAPTSGNANSVDMYTFTVVQTAANTFSVFAAQTRFA